MNHGAPNVTALEHLIILLYVNEFSQKTKRILKRYNLQTMLVYYVALNQEKKFQA